MTSPSELSPTAGTPAEPVLEQIAAAADAQPVESRPDDHTTQHIVTDQWRLEVDGDTGNRAVRPVRVERWLLANGRSRVIERQTGATFTPDGRLTTPRGPGRVVSDDWFAPSSEFPATWADTLPTDPGGLARQWGTADPEVVDPLAPGAAVATRIDMAMTMYATSPDTRATLWRALALTGEARSLGTTHDRAGRTGEAVSVWNDLIDTLTVFVIDPNNGALLESDEVAIEPGADPMVVSFTHVVSSGWIAG